MRTTFDGASSQEDPNFERELNDSLELAEPLELGAERRGWIGGQAAWTPSARNADAKGVIAHETHCRRSIWLLRVVDRRDRSGSFA